MELSLFSYQPAKSPLTKVSPGLKLAALLVSVILLFYMDLVPSTILLSLLIALSLPLGFSLKSQLQDFKPVLFYLMVYCLAAIIGNCSRTGVLSPRLFIPPKTIALSIVRLLAAVQLARFFYKTTTTSQLKFSLEKIEMALRSAFRRIPALGKTIHSRPRLTFTFTMVIHFVPRLMGLWNQLELAWKARGGKKGPAMICSLFPRLFVLAFTDADATWQAVASREKDLP